MCDYSLHHVASRPAKAGDRLVSTRFSDSITRGFAAADDKNTAVCLLPGTELAFDRNVEYDPSFPLLPKRRMADRVARFREVDLDQPMTHHDALEFPNGQVILVTRLVEGQRLTVLQTPAMPRDEAVTPHRQAEPAPQTATRRPETVR